MMNSRFLITSLLVSIIAVPFWGRADELSHRDKISALYSHQISFDQRGIPLIKIAVVENAEAITISGQTPITLLPDGTGGTEISGSQLWRITRVKSSPAQIEYFVVLQRARKAELSALQHSSANWEKKGAKCSVVELGAIFGLEGTVFDNRAYVLMDGPYRSIDAAQAASRRWAAGSATTRYEVIPQLKTLPSATLSLRSHADEKLNIAARDVVWFTAPPSTALTVSVNGQQVGRYHGELYVTVNRHGNLAAVNVVSAEHLLHGLVPAEIFPSAPAHALSAQSVAARGDLISKLGTRHRADPYSICAEQHCQVYKGVAHEHENTTAAVNATRGQVLLRPNGDLANTLYSAVCGGHTEDNNQVWPQAKDPILAGHLDAPAGTNDYFKNGLGNPGDPKTSNNDAQLQSWLTTKTDTWCGRSRFNREKYRWQVSLTFAELSQLTANLQIGTVQNLRVLSRGRSGRATLVEVVGQIGRRQIQGELTIRKQFGNLRSTMFIVGPYQDPTGKTIGITLRGGGWGHGVGMCQTGAAAMADAGLKYQTILQHYYPGSVLKKIY